VNIHRPTKPTAARAAALLLYDNECGLGRWQKEHGLPARGFGGK
jgi:hypothetical protein